MRISNNPAKHDVLIKQYLCSILDISGSSGDTWNAGIVRRAGDDGRWKGCIIHPIKQLDHELEISTAFYYIDRTLRAL